MTVNICNFYELRYLLTSLCLIRVVVSQTFISGFFLFKQKVIVNLLYFQEAAFGVAEVVMDTEAAGEVMDTEGAEAVMDTEVAVMVGIEVLIVVQMGKKLN